MGAMIVRRYLCVYRLVAIHARRPGFSYVANWGNLVGEIPRGEVSSSLALLRSPFIWRSAHLMKGFVNLHKSPPTLIWRLKITRGPVFVWLASDTAILILMSSTIHCRRIILWMKSFPRYVGAIKRQWCNDCQMIVSGAMEINIMRLTSHFFSGVGWGGGRSYKIVSTSPI